MRVITIHNFSTKPPRLLATVTMKTNGQIAIEGAMKERLENGVYNFRTRELLGLESGNEYMNAVLMEYKGTYIRAQEVKA